MQNKTFEAAALASLAQIGSVKETLQALYEQPDRAIYLASQQKLILKVCSETSKLEKEALMLRKAREANVLVPEILQLTNEKPSVLIMKALSGNPITSNSINAAKEAGRDIERFHNIGAQPPFSNGSMRWKDFILTWASKELNDPELLKAFSSSELQRLANRFSAQKELFATRPVKLIHGDLQSEHIFINAQTDQLTGIIDFADAQPGDPLMDIAVVSLWDHELASLILAGYEDIDYDTDIEELLRLYRLLRWIAEVPWLLKRGFDQAAQRDIAAIKQILG